MKIASTIRDPKILAQRRAELVEVATTLFLERGFHKTSIRDIARACPFNLAALYMYVSSKEDILFLVAQQLVNEVLDELEPASMADGDPAKALRLAFENYCAVVNRYSRHIRLLYRELDLLSPEAREPILRSVEKLQSIFETLIVRGIEAKRVRKVNPKVAALDLMVLAHAWALHGRALRSHLKIEEFTRQQCDIVLGGLFLDAPAKPRRKENGDARRRRPSIGKNEKSAVGARAGKVQKAEMRDA
jgi:AcrR family transcriptional regulator